MVCVFFVLAWASAIALSDAAFARSTLAFASAAPLSTVAFASAWALSIIAFVCTSALAFASATALSIAAFVFTQTVLVVRVHAVFTPAPHVEVGAHVAHGAVPDVENVAPTVHDWHDPEASHTVHPEADTLAVQQRPLAQESVSHSPSAEQIAPAASFAEHLDSALRKKLDVQVEHLPLEASHAAHPLAYAVDIQQRFPAHELLLQCVSAEHVPPADFLLGKHSSFVLVYPLEHVEQSPSESQSVHPVLLPLMPQQLPPRHTPLEQEVL